MMTLTGEYYYIPASKVGDQCTVGQFKDLLSEECERSPRGLIPPYLMRLQFAGRELEDMRCVVDLVGGTPTEPGPGPVLHLILRLRGC